MEFSWFYAAILSSLIYTIITLGDKWLISWLKLPLPNFFLFVGIVQFITSILIFIIFGIPELVFYNIFFSYLGGFMWGIALMLMFKVLRNEEAGRVTPIWQTSPIFAAIAGMIFLNENIDKNLWVAIFLVVCGAFLISSNTSYIRKISFNKKLLIVLLGAVIIGFAQVSLKVGSENLSVTHNLAVRALGLTTSIGLPFAKFDKIKELLTFIFSNKKAMPIFLIEGIFPLLGNLCVLYALANGPVSLVSPLLGTRPIFLIGIILILGPLSKKYLNEKLERSQVSIKVISIMLVVSGVVIISSQ